MGQVRNFLGEAVDGFAHFAYEVQSLVQLLQELCEVGISSGDQARRGRNPPPLHRRGHRFGRPLRPRCRLLVDARIIDHSLLCRHPPSRIGMDDPLLTRPNCHIDVAVLLSSSSGQFEGRQVPA